MKSYAKHDFDVDCVQLNFYIAIQMMNAVNNI